MVKTVTIRNIPDGVYQTLRDRARAQHRSMQEEMRLILQRESGTTRGQVCETAAAYRAKFQERVITRSVVDDIREDRDR